MQGDEFVAGYRSERFSVEVEEVIAFTGGSYKQKCIGLVRGGISDVCVSVDRATVKGYCREITRPPQQVLWGQHEKQQYAKQD